MEKVPPEPRAGQAGLVGDGRGSGREGRALGTGVAGAGGQSAGDVAGLLHGEERVGVVGGIGGADLGGRGEACRVRESWGGAGDEDEAEGSVADEKVATPEDEDAGGGGEGEGGRLVRTNWSV